QWNSLALLGASGAFPPVTVVTAVLVTRRYGAGLQSSDLPTYYRFIRTRTEEVDMRAHISLRLAVLALLPLGLACSSTTARLDDGTTTTARDTSSVQNPPGYQGMPRDT